jgi:hypothetical protein
LAVGEEMKSYEVFLTNQIKEHDNTITILAWCFLIAWPLFLFLLYIIINMFIANSFPNQDVQYNFPEWSINAMSDYLNTIWILLTLLFIWASINSIQLVYDILFGIRDWFYFRKWGERGD